jgi:hypothetical protein
MKQLYLLICIFIFVGISGCAGNMKNLNAAWEHDNKQMLNKIGTKEYKNVSKEKAVNAMAIAFQKLDIVITSSDFRTGLLAGIATAPKPLSYEEFEVVKAIEDSRARTHVPMLIWDLTGFDSIFNVFILETDDGVQASVRAKLNFRGNKEIVPVSEFPPKAMEIAINKIWDEFEKTLFIQGKTLK